MSDSEDYSDADDGLSERIRGSAEAEPPTAAASAGHASDGRTWAEGTWAQILADYVGEARRQEQVTKAYLEARLGMRL